jgi:glycosyltransferase involved in cell wall biosynthesis
VNEPKVGIVIPCHNHSQYIVECIDSVINQNYINKEICIVDDGSTDNLQNVLQDKLGKMPACRDLPLGIQCFNYNGVKCNFVRNEVPQGPSASRNKGFEILSDCRYYIPLDADDYLLEGKIRKSVEIFEEDPQNIGLVYHDVLIYNEMQGLFSHEYREPYSRRRLEQEDIITNCSMISKLALQTVGSYDPTMRTCEDFELWVRISARFMCIHLAEPLSVYRVTGKNASDTISKEVWNQNWSKVAQRIRQQHQH